MIEIERDKHDIEKDRDSNEIEMKVEIHPDGSPDEEVLTLTELLVKFKKYIYKLKI